MSSLQHPFLGPIRGKAGDGIIQYLGIKYASLKHRFGTPQLYSGHSPDDSEVIDATKLGPAAIGIPDGCQAEYGLIQQSLPIADLPPQSDTECLNLSITVPEGYTSPRPSGSRNKLPVFVFVHGGALSMGSGTWPQYDNAALVRRSIELGKPVIGVNINYRTGIFGFLTSEELRKAGFKSNNGLRDQKVALQWVKRYIEGFGGDSEQITAIGQSAGGASLTLLLQSPEPLFNRLVNMSGTCLLLRPLPPAVHEAFYSAFCEVQGLTSVSGEARLQAIEKLDSTEMLLKMPPSIPSLPALDEDFLTEGVTFESVELWHKTDNDGKHKLPGLDWCKELFVGDCEFDGNIYQLALGHRQYGIAEQLTSSLRRNVPASKVSEITSLLSAYGISPSSSPSPEKDASDYLSTLYLGNDIAFYLPSWFFSRYFPGKTFVYHINEPNPWDGPFKGHATHIFDVALLFKNFDAKLEKRTKAVGEEFGDAVLKFVARGREGGEQQGPWRESTRDRPVAMAFGGLKGQGERMSKLVEGDKPEDVGRRDMLFRYKDSIGFDILHEAFMAFLGGK